MRLHRLVRPCLLLLLAFCSLPTGAAPSQPSNLRSDILYTTRGEFVQVSPMRPLTLNAHIQQFAYEPLGLEVAIVGSEVQGDQTIHFVKTMDVRSGREMSRLTATALTNKQYNYLYLVGLTIIIKYLLLQNLASNPQPPAAPTEEYLRWDLSANPPVAHPLDPESHLPPDAQAIPGLGYAIPSPDRRWIVFKQYFQAPDSDGKPGPRQIAYVLYDPERDTYRLLALPTGTTTYQWSDENHLRLRQKGAFQQFDVLTGQVSPIRAAPPEATPLASKKYPDLTLDVEYRRQEDRKGSGGYLESCLLWICTSRI